MSVVLCSPALLIWLEPAHGGEILDLVDQATGRQPLRRPPFGFTLASAGLVCAVRLIEDDDALRRLTCAFDLALIAQDAVAAAAEPGVREIDLNSAGQAAAQCAAGAPIEFGGGLLSPGSAWKTDSRSRGEHVPRDIQRWGRPAELT